MGVRELYRAARADLDMIRDRDPSMQSRTEALLHPGVLAIWSYRVAHRMHQRDLRRSARFLSAVAKVFSGGIEIHPGAEIGRRFFIDHGTGTVIGETAVIGDDVTVFHQVTLGSVGWWHDRDRPEESRRHPKLGDRVVIGANATLLGPITVKSDAVIGAQALVIRDVSDGKLIVAPTAQSRTARPHRTTERRKAGALTVVAGAHEDRSVVSFAFPSW